MDFIIDGLNFYDFDEGEYICQQGKQGTYFFIVHSGDFDVLSGAYWRFRCASISVLGMM